MDVEPVLDCTVDHVVPLSVERSILYPVTAAPPLFDGAVQDKLICDEDAVVVVRPVGDPGAVGVPDELDTEYTSPPYMLAGIDATTELLESYTLIVPDNGNLYMPTFSVAVPALTGEVARTFPAVSTIFTITALEGLLVT